jgi:hypothetical protein
MDKIVMLNTDNIGKKASKVYSMRASGAEYHESELHPRQPEIIA